MEYPKQRRFGYVKLRKYLYLINIYIYILKIHSLVLVVLQQKAFLPSLSPCSFCNPYLPQIPHPEPEPHLRRSQNPNLISVAKQKRYHDLLWTGKGFKISSLESIWQSQIELGPKPINPIMVKSLN
jgi:hypothetical protein